MGSFRAFHSILGVSLQPESIKAHLVTYKAVAEEILVSLEVPGRLDR